MIEAGEGISDITPPVGVELAGFHKPPGKERKVTGAREATKARALVLRSEGRMAAILSLDVLGLSQDFARAVQKKVAAKTKIPAKNVRVCCTHTHSAPTLMFLRQWGAVSSEYNELVEQRAVEATIAAAKDLAPADLYFGMERVKGGNFNRTSKTWKTDAELATSSTDAERWLDTRLQVLHFLREKPKRNLLWYRFSAHPVCYTDGLSGPDWPGLVVAKTRERDGLEPGYLQGNCGDVNPGDGDPHLGNPEEVSEAVWTALHHATNHSTHVPVKRLHVETGEVDLPLDLDRLKSQLERYRNDPAACTKGEWVDAGFAKDWFEDASKWKMSRSSCAAPLSVLGFGELAMLFHPAELYSFYGLAIERDSEFSHTIVCGYADDMVGYVTDPAAYEKNEYAAIVVPKIIGLPPFKPEAGRVLASQAVNLLKKAYLRARLER